MMKDKNNFNEAPTGSADELFDLHWVDFVGQIDKMTGGGASARQLFIDARERHLATRDKRTKNAIFAIDVPSKKPL